MKKQRNNIFSEDTTAIGLITIIIAVVLSYNVTFDKVGSLTVIFGPIGGIFVFVHLLDKYFDWLMKYGRWLGGLIFLSGVILTALYLPDRSTPTGAWGMWIAFVGILTFSSTLPIFLKKPNNHKAING